MGLFGFLKKKPQEQQPQADFNLDSLQTDLPSIHGSELNLPPLTADPAPLPSLDKFDLPPLDNADVPQFNFGQQQTQTQSIPTAQNRFAQQPPAPAQRLPELPGFADNTFIQPQAAFQAPVIKPAVQSADKPAVAKQPVQIDPEDLQHLFLEDDFKEPDWQNFEVYHEEKIDPPSLEDFKPLPSLPGFDPGTEDMTLSQKFLDSKKRTTRKVDIFVKSEDYKKVFSELETLDNLLTTQDYKVGLVNSCAGEQETVLNILKDDLDFMQKRLLIIDKRIFVN